MSNIAVKPTDSTEETELLAEEEGGQWPNEQPVPAGVAEVSQDPALFDGEEEEEEVGKENKGAELTVTAAAAAVGSVSGMLTQARKTLGLGESPPGSDHNLITVWYNANIAKIGNGAWCNMAVTYWAGHSSNLGAIFAGKGVGYAYTVAHAKKFQKVGRWHAGTAGIKAGDVVFFDWAGSRSIGAIDHVGVVERVSGGAIYTIEGNLSNKCARVKRDAKYIVGYGRPNYGATTPVPVPSPTTVSLARVVAAAKRDPGLPQGGTTHKADVLPVEKALAAEGLLDAKYVDGSFGTLTVTAYKAWQKRLGYSGSDADGIPGMTSLTKLGAKHGFKVA